MILLWAFNLFAQPPDTLWTRTYGGTGNEAGFAIQQIRLRRNGGYIIVGETESFGNGRQVWVIKTAPDFVGTDEPKSFRKELPIIQITPNPFKNQTWIRYELIKSSNVTLALYNILGKKIKTLLNCEQNQGRYTITLDGLDRSGKKVSSGIYFLRFKLGEYNTIRRIFMIGSKM